MISQKFKKKCTKCSNLHPPCPYLFYVYYFFDSTNAITTTWTGGSGSFSQSQIVDNTKWSNGAPSSTDDAIITSDLTFTVSSSLTWNSLTCSSPSSFVLIIQGTGTVFTIDTNFYQTAGCVTCNLASGTSFLIVDYFVLTNTVNFNNNGTIQFNPNVNSSSVTLTNTGKNTYK